MAQDSVRRQMSFTHCFVIPAFIALAQLLQLSYALREQPGAG
jgi:hypothetical protein